MVEYDVGFDAEGRVSALKVRGYFLCGADMDLVRLPLLIFGLLACCSWLHRRDRHGLTSMRCCRCGCRLDLEAGLLACAAVARMG